MLSSAWKQIETNLLGRWVATALTPAVIFWSVGLFVLTVNDWQRWENYLLQLSPISQNTLVVGGILVLVVSASIVRGLEGPILHLLEGDWPEWLKILLYYPVQWYKNRLHQAESRWQALALKENLTYKERREHDKLDKQLRLAPAESEDWMPTSLGNRLLAAELQPLDKYGLNPSICWPRLWLLLSEKVQGDLTTARDHLNSSIHIWTWSVIFMIWGLWVWWLAVVGLIAAWLVYRYSILNSAEIYGELIESAFDVYRIELYKASRWPLPANAHEEAGMGQQLTQYLWRGAIGKTLMFIDQPVEHSSNSQHNSKQQSTLETPQINWDE